MLGAAIIRNQRAGASYTKRFSLRQHYRIVHRSSSTKFSDRERATVVSDHIKSIKDPSIRHEVLAKCFRTLSSAEVQAIFKNADKNQDGTLTLKEFQKLGTKPPRSTSSAAAIAFKNRRTVPDHALTSSELRQLVLCMGLPYIGFGFVDNFLMLSAGDLIESNIGSAFHLSTLAAAALGNTVSDVAGIGMGGVIQSISTKLGFPPPSLTAKQQSSTTVRVTTLAASVVGITIGCLLGMIPLAFINNKDSIEDSASTDESVAAVV